MIYVFIFLAVMLVFAGYLCAKVIQHLTKKMWLGFVFMLCPVVSVLSLYFKNAFADSPLITDIFCNFGYIYLGFALYFTIYICLAFGFYYCCKKIQLKKLLGAGFIVVPVFLFLAYLNAINPQVEELNIEGDSDLTICFVSDIHIGCVNTKHILNRVVNKIEECHPDIVILGGDVLDIGSLKKYGEFFISTMKQITSKYKTYAVIGNHEIYAGANDCIKILRKAGVIMLLDNVAIEKEFTIAGRLDRIVGDRKPLSQIVAPGIKNLIVVDHSPFRVDEAVDHKALLYLAGHTHAGQMFPMNLVVKYMFGSTSVLKKIKDTYTYISCGAGFWGPPFRIGSIPEVMLVKIRAKK